jgi:hypothetical protein
MQSNHEDLCILVDRCLCSSRWSWCRARSASFSSTAPTRRGRELGAKVHILLAGFCLDGEFLLGRPDLLLCLLFPFSVLRDKVIDLTLEVERALFQLRRELIIIEAFLCFNTEIAVFRHDALVYFVDLLKVILTGALVSENLVSH